MIFLNRRHFREVDEDEPVQKTQPRGNVYKAQVRPTPKHVPPPQQLQHGYTGMTQGQPILNAQRQPGQQGHINGLPNQNGYVANTQQAYPAGPPTYPAGAQAFPGGAQAYPHGGRSGQPGMQRSTRSHPHAGARPTPAGHARAPPPKRNSQKKTRARTRN